MKFLSLFLLTVALIVASPAAHAVSQSASAFRVLAATTNVPASTGSWLVLDAGTLKSVQGISVSNTLQDSSGVNHDVQIGIAEASASTNAEVQQMIVSSTTASTMTYLPFSTSGQVRISILSADTTVLSKGELVLNLLYY